MDEARLGFVVRDIAELGDTRLGGLEPHGLAERIGRPCYLDSQIGYFLDVHGVSFGYDCHLPIRDKQEVRVETKRGNA